MQSQPTNRVLLSVQNVYKVFGGLMAVNDVSFNVFEGEIAALIGPNGAGKTTLFNLITGFHSMDQGAIIFDGEPIDGLLPHQITMRGIVRTFQNLQIFHNLSVIENVMVGLHLQGRSGILAAALRLPAARREEAYCRERAHHFLRLVGLEQRAADPAADLPFGQQRLLEIARALAANPRLLLLDEPAAGLSPPEVTELDALICQLRDQGVTILLVEHDMDLVMGIADRVIVLHFGRKIAEGSPAEVQSNQEVVQAYLGTDWGLDGFKTVIPKIRSHPEVR